MPQRRDLKVLRTFAGLAFLCVLAMLCVGCHRTSDEVQVREAITAAATAARDNDADGVLGTTSDDFIGHDGVMDRHGLRQMLALRALRHDSTGVLVGPITVERQGDRLVATFTLTLTGGRTDSLLPDQADLFDMTTAWRREGRHWRCYSANWRRRF